MRAITRLRIAVTRLSLLSGLTFLLPLFFLLNVLTSFPWLNYSIVHYICQEDFRKKMGKFDYNSKEWKHLAKIALCRDGYKCQLSKRYGKNIPAELVHHIYPVDEYPEYAYCLWNLISLSRAIHNTLHDRNTDKLTADGVALMRRTKPR